MNLKSKTQSLEFATNENHTWFANCIKNSLAMSSVLYISVVVFFLL